MPDRRDAETFGNGLISGAVEDIDRRTTDAGIHHASKFSHIT